MALDDYEPSRDALRTAIASSAEAALDSELGRWAQLEDPGALRKSVVTAHLRNLWPDAPSVSIEDIQRVEAEINETELLVPDRRKLPTIVDVVRRHAVFGVYVLMAVLYPPSPEAGRTTDVEQRIRIVQMRSIAERTQRLAKHAVWLQSLPE